jgi:hypothetical protein
MMQAALLESPMAVEAEAEPVLSSKEAVVEAMSDLFSFAVVRCTIKSAKTIEEIATETGIPLSSCYRKVSRLVDERILLLQRIVVTSAGKRRACYRAAISEATIVMDREGLRVSLVPNGDIADKLQSAWLSIRYPTTRA